MSVQATEAPEKVARLLGQMSTALRERDYRGLFTYEFGGALQTLRITHRVEDGAEYEHLEYLNGPSRRIERNGTHVSCLSPADQVLRGLLPGLDSSFHGLTQHYHFYFRDDERIAGRLASVVQIVPRDEYRYGYSLSIDKETALPLAVMTISSSRRVLERLQFANIELEADDSWVGIVDSSTLVKRAEWPACQPLEGTMAGLGPWSVSWVPSGFLPAGSASFERVGDVMLYTDGLSAFSVFVRPLEKAVAAQGKAQRGATVAYMQQQMFDAVPHTITVVGEIPARTAQRIAASVRALKPTPPTVPEPAAAEESSGTTIPAAGAAPEAQTGQVE
ncbi:transcriptional regulator [Pseudomaricurvus alkylphenolicus]|uniref:MucB/RseB C-terminal domain-containing protein n=1 Tax=Pseudomaricurvus alkylphenolicus TaxID=1306991 RepID=UPI00142386C4|nr:MucB/RseB C-terminal domain-containing protein [Pseudomaricurvus alkylphenolicus]NIB43314.1 transcriptional regulator [Pseudomaricurvus alkylphenolicus]